MRRGYSLSSIDIDVLTPIMEGIIWRLEQRNIDDIELSVINLGPSQFMDLLKHLGYDLSEDEGWDTNGWEQDTWYYLTKEGYSNLTLFYCGYDGEIRLRLSDTDD